MTDLVPFPGSLDPHSLAEWIEWIMLVEETYDFSTTEILAQFPSGQRPPAQDLEVALAIVEERADGAPSLYPFRRLGDRVVRTGQPDLGDTEVDACLYSFFRLVGLERPPWAMFNRAADVGSLFDYPVRDAMLEWMGTGSDAVVFGWPPRDERPGAFGDAVTWLADRLGLPDGDQDRPADAKDGGVDCVVWKSAPDGRTGFPIWLVQASVEHELVRKAGQVIPIESWKRWIKFGAGPVTVFASGHSVPKGSTTWMELNDAAVQVADRNRLLHYLHKANVGHERPSWWTEICGFVAEEFTLIRKPGPDEAVPRVRRRKRERSTEHADPRAR